MPKGIPASGINKGWFKKGEIPFPENQFKKGQHCSFNTEFKKGQRYFPDNGFKRGEHPSVKTEFKKGQTIGEKNCKWKGGITSAMDTLRKIPEYAQWRLLVYERDNYTCQMCGHKHTDIVAHHIKSFAENEELRFEVSNGVVLCRSCHLKLHRQLVMGETA